MAHLGPQGRLGRDEWGLGRGGRSRSPVGELPRVEADSTAPLQDERRGDPRMPCTGWGDPHTPQPVKDPEGVPGKSVPRWPQIP